jgi:inorganic pyrophosphatase
MVCSCIINLYAKEIVLRSDGNYRLLSNVHLVNEVPYKKESYQALIEVPAGTTAKWEVDHKTGHLEWEFKKGKPRNVKFIGYLGNYGFIPQSILSKDEGGDGDPLDVIVLGPSVEKGTVQQVKILGAIKLLDKGEQDDKIIAVPLTGPFEKIDSLGEMIVKFPGVIGIIRYWFEGYKGSKIHFMGYMKRKKAEALVEKAHISWDKNHNKY